MSPPSIEPDDLLDLKLMPAWVKESAGRQDYAAYQGEEFVQGQQRQFHRGPRREKPARKDGPPSHRTGRREREGKRRRDRDREKHPTQPGHGRPAVPPTLSPLEVAVEFLPRPIVLENVVSQVKAGSVAYSLFFL